MWSFLTFETLISIEVLIAFYYMGALLMPIFIVWLMLWLKAWLASRAPLVNTGIEAGKQLIVDQVSWQSRVKWALLLVTAFLFAELFWRLLFEFLIAFIQMRDALVLGG